MALGESEFAQFLESIRKPKYYDCSLDVNKYLLQINSAKVAYNSSFFSTLLSGNYCETSRKTIEVFLPNENIIMFEVLIHFLQTDLLVIPKCVSENDLFHLVEQAIFLNEEKLVRVCEQQLCGKIILENIEKMLSFAEKNDMNNLLEACIEKKITWILDNDDYEELKKSL